MEIMPTTMHTNTVNDNTTMAEVLAEAVLADTDLEQVDITPTAVKYEETTGSSTIAGNNTDVVDLDHSNVNEDTTSVEATNHDMGPSPENSNNNINNNDDFLKRVKTLKKAVVNAAKIKDEANRDISLIRVLRTCREELEAAESADSIAAGRVVAAKDVYSFCAQLLAGYSPLEVRLSEKKRGGIGGSGWTGGGASGAAAMKRSRHDSSLERESEMDGGSSVAEQDDKDGMMNVNDGSSQPPGIMLPDNPIHMPAIHTSGGGMSEELVAIHRENFYKSLINVSASELDDYIPDRSNANLKSKSQLVEWIYIARHWNTGADGLDAGSFRARHKTWYSRMKPVTENLGRRTGIHLRTLEGEGEGETVTVLCRYSKDGTKSIVYLDVGRIYDAIFEIHAVELGHRGRDVVKNRADERYANIPDGQVRIFIDNCPICVARRGGGVRNSY